MTSGHDFTLDEFIRTGGYVLSAEPEANRALPLQLFWRMLLRKLMRATGKVPLTILMDEGLAAGKIPNLRQALETLRNRGVSLWMGIQSESGLLDVYSPTTGKAIIDTFGNRITLLHGLDSQDAENLSKRLGNWTMRRKAPNQQAQVSPVPLLTTSEMSARGKRMEDRWAVFEMRESALSGFPLIARTLEAAFPTRRPSAQELEAFYQRFPDLRPEVAGRLGREGGPISAPEAEEGPEKGAAVAEVLRGLTAPPTAGPTPVQPGSLSADAGMISGADALAEIMGGKSSSAEPKGPEVEGIQARVATEEALGGVEAGNEALEESVTEAELVCSEVGALESGGQSEVTTEKQFSVPW